VLAVFADAAEASTGVDAVAVVDAVEVVDDDAPAAVGIVCGEVLEQAVTNTASVKIERANWGRMG
jgi:hypothetical protein